MSTTICDDEKSEREQVGEILVQRMRKRGESLQIVYFEQGEDLIEQYEGGDQYPKYGPIFMDIYLQGLNGMEIIYRLRKHDRSAAVILMSSSPDYAIGSYDIWADDCLLKSIVQGRMENVLNRFMEYQYPKNKKSLPMVDGSSSRRTFHDDVMYIESWRMNLRTACAKGVEHIIRRKLDEVRAELTQPGLLRCNQSYTVSIDYITRADTDFTMENSDRALIKVREWKRVGGKYLAYTLERGWDGM